MTLQCLWRKSRFIFRPFKASRVSQSMQTIEMYEWIYHPYWDEFEWLEVSLASPLTSIQYDSTGQRCHCSRMMLLVECHRSKHFSYPFKAFMGFASAYTFVIIYQRSSPRKFYPLHYTLYILFPLFPCGYINLSIFSSALQFYIYLDLKILHVLYHLGTNFL